MINFLKSFILGTGLICLSSIVFAQSNNENYGNARLLNQEDDGFRGIEQIDIAPVWSVHRAGPPELLTRDGRQYVAYFDHDRFLTVAQAACPCRVRTGAGICSGYGGKHPIMPPTIHYLTPALLAVTLPNGSLRSELYSG